MTALTPLTVKLDSNTARRLEQAARSAHKQPSTLAEEAIAQYLDVHDWQVAKVLRGIEAADRGDFASDADLKRLLARFDVDA